MGPPPITACHGKMTSAELTGLPKEVSHILAKKWTKHCVRTCHNILDKDDTPQGDWEKSFREKRASVTAYLRGGRGGGGGLPGPR